MEAARGAAPEDAERSPSAPRRGAGEGRPPKARSRAERRLPEARSRAERLSPEARSPAEARPREARSPAGRRGRGKPPAAPTRGSRSAREPAPAGDRLRRSFLWWGRAAFALGAAYLFWQVLLIARGVVGAVLAIILMTAISAVIAVVCAPAVDVLTARARLPRTLATLLILFGLLAAVGGLVLLVVRPLVDEGQHLLAALPLLQERLDALRTWLLQRGIKVGSFDLRSLATTFLGGSQATSGFLISAVTGTLSALVDLIVVVVTSFWFLRDGRLLRRSVLDSLPSRWRSNVDFGFKAFAVVIGGYVRGQLLMALMVGVMAGIGSAVIGVPFPLVVATAAGVFELIPLVGPFVGGAVAALLALTVNLFLVIEVVALFLGIHLIEGYLVAPRLQGRYVRLHPVVAFLALFTGIEVAGFLGALIAVPLASLVAVIVQAILGDVRAQRPELFAAGGRGTRTPQERRRRQLLQRYRIRYREALRRLAGRLRGRR